jgi:RNAse (barnase) inhibitor barstar
MTEPMPWVRGELPWLKSGPLHRVHEQAMPAVDAFLDRWNYERVNLDGREMTSRPEAHSELHLAFGFPDWCGKNWDAFDDCFDDFVQEHDGARIAVLWRHLDVAAREAPATTAEVGWALLESQFGHMPNLAAEGRSSVTLDIFVIGEGPDFDRPE